MRHRCIAKTLSLLFVAQMLHWKSIQDKYEKKKITAENQRKQKKEILYLVVVIRMFLIMFWGRKNRKELYSSSLVLRYSLLTWKLQRKKNAIKNVDVPKWERAPQSSFELIKFISRARNIPYYISPCNRDVCFPYIIVWSFLKKNFVSFSHNLQTLK